MDILQKPFLAHIAEDREQTVLEHLKNTAELAASFAAVFDAEEQGRLAGMAHDIGKYSAEFQKRLRGGIKVDHATAGAWECSQKGENFAAFAVMGHHSGLPDGGGQGDNATPTFFGRLKKAEHKELPDYSAWRQELTLPEANRPAYINESAASFSLMFFIRMLYSCLVDADFLDTENFMTNGAALRDTGDTVNILEQKLQQYIGKWEKLKSPLNRERTKILQHCREQGDEQNSGLFTLTVPTGGGKTIASAAFALRHAIKNGLRKIIYVIPYTSIIEQNAGEYRKIFGENNVLEHHANIFYNEITDNEKLAENMKLAAENWDKPIVVTTAVQFFESLFANRASRCRKLHNIADSVIIFDEAQMLPLPFLRPCIAAITELVRHYGASAVFCTATQPALDKIINEFLLDKKITEICPKTVYEPEVFRRACYRQAGLLSRQELADKLNACRQVLCVVNSRQNAREIYDLLDGDGAFHLSTLMYPEHRQAVLAEIRRRLKDNLPCRVVSTSLIEAGVDVDFPAVYREEAGLDSIIQAGGRCNREGKNPWQQSVVTIFKTESKTPPFIKTQTDVVRNILANNENPDITGFVEEYFNKLFYLKGKDSQDQKKILHIIDDNLMPFKTVDGLFKLIDSAAQTVYIPLGEGEVLLNRLHGGERSRELFRRLGRFGVPVYQQHFEALHSAGDIELIDKEIAVLTNCGLYSEETGLSLEADNGKALFI